MKAALKSEFAILGTFIPAFAVMLVPICVIMAFAIGNCISAVACVSAMVPMILVFSLASYDDQNGWKRYRASLSFSRRDIIAARYGSILLASLLTAACATILGIAINAILPSFMHDFETMQTIEIAAGSLTATFSVIVWLPSASRFSSNLAPQRACATLCVSPFSPAVSASRLQGKCSTPCCLKTSESGPMPT